MILLDLPPYIGRRLHSLDASPTVFLLTPAELPCELDEKATITTDATTVERDDLFTIPTASGIKPRKCRGNDNHKLYYHVFRTV